MRTGQPTRSVAENTDDLEDIDPTSDASRPTKPSTFLDSAPRRRAPIIEGFENFHFIGEGRDGEVWRAMNTRIGRMVAVKILPRMAAYSVQLKARFKKEIRRIGPASFRNIVRVIDASTTRRGESNVPYYVMEWMAGGTLSKYVERCPLPLHRRLALMVDICRGVRLLHIEHGLVHLDLKPQNILMDSTSEAAVPHVSDFGIAEWIGYFGDAGFKRTRHAPQAGTLAYMSPEHWAALADRADCEGLTTEADVFSLGVVFFELLTGRRPFDFGPLTPCAAKAAESARIIIADVVMNLEDRLGSVAEQIGPRMVATLRRALAIDAGDRHRNAGVLQEELLAESKFNWYRNLFKSLDAETTTLEEVRAEIAFQEEWERYKKRTADANGLVELLGVERTLKTPLNLADIYMPLFGRGPVAKEHADCCSDGTVVHSRDANKDEAAPIALLDALSTIDRTKRGIVLLGGLGAGKTTFLKHLAVEALDRTGEKMFADSRRRYPVFISLAQFRGEPTVRGFTDFLNSRIAENLKEFSNEFRRRLSHDHRRLLLLDGLDEIADMGARRAAAEFLAQPTHEFDGDVMITTCREHGFRGYVGDDESSPIDLSRNYLILSLLSLTSRQSSRFVEKWYAAAADIELQGNEEHEQKLNEECRQLVTRLEAIEHDPAGDRLREMAGNPLLLTMMCIVHRQGSLPNRRFDLYQKCLDLLLHRWPIHRTSGTPLEAAEAADCLGPLALWLHERGEVDGKVFAKDIEIIDAMVDRRFESSRRWRVETADQFLKTIRNTFGLFTGEGDRDYRFIHLGLQEFLAAKVIAQDPKPTRVKNLARRFGESWWRETTLLLMAQPFPHRFEELMREALKMPAVVDNADLLDACVTEAFADRPLNSNFVREIDAVRTDWAGVFKELVLRSPGCGEDRLWERQLVAWRILRRAFPKESASLHREVANHPHPEFKLWARGLTIEDHLRSSRNIRIDKVTGVEFVVIPAGQLRIEDETAPPELRGKVVPIESFELARTPITFGQWQRFIARDGREVVHRGGPPRASLGPDHPIVDISWYEADSFCLRYGYSLPNEWQWEYACRGRTSPPSVGRYDDYWLAKNDLLNDDNNDRPSIDVTDWWSGNSCRRVHPVATKPPNPFGLFDMQGNAWEWCRDEFAPQRRVIRGGGFTSASCGRSGYRDWYHPVFRLRNLTFRPARPLTE